VTKSLCFLRTVRYRFQCLVVILSAIFGYSHLIARWTEKCRRFPTLRPSSKTKLSGAGGTISFSRPRLYFFPTAQEKNNNNNVTTVNFVFPASPSRLNSRKKKMFTENSISIFTPKAQEFPSRPRHVCHYFISFDCIYPIHIS